MRFLLLTLFPALLSGCFSQDDKFPDQTMNEEKLCFVNAKWKDTLLIRVLQDSLQRATGYLLGGDTFNVDSSSKIDSTYNYIRNSRLQQFIEAFCDSMNEKPIHPTPVNYTELELLICNEAFKDTTYQWMLLDTGNSVSAIYFQEINLDNNRHKELVIEIASPQEWEHRYSIFQNNNLEFQLAGTLSTINRNAAKTPIERIDKADYWATSSSGWGTGYGAIYHTYYKLLDGNIIQVSEPITIENYHALYGSSTDEFAYQSMVNAEISFPDPNTLSLTYSYTLLALEDTIEHLIINQAHYRTYYTMNGQRNRFETRDPYITRGEVVVSEEIELTPVFANELERLRLHGSAIQRRLLRMFSKKEWVMFNNN